jgi:hydrogenase maturation protease
MLLIIAYGNTLRGDDGAGPALGELIERCCRQRSIQVRRLVCHQLTPELVTEMIRPGVAQVLFCDARTSSPSDPGLGLKITPLEPAGGGTAIGHHLSPATLLLLARDLYHCEVPAWQLTVPGFTFELGQPFSVPTRRALDEVEPLLESFLGVAAVASTSPHVP